MLLSIGRAPLHTRPQCCVDHGPGRIGGWRSRHACPPHAPSGAASIVRLAATPPRCARGLAAVWRAALHTRPQCCVVHGLGRIGGWRSCPSLPSPLPLSLHTGYRHVLARGVLCLAHPRPPSRLDSLFGGRRPCAVCADRADCANEQGDSSASARRPRCLVLFSGLDERPDVLDGWPVRCGGSVSFGGAVCVCGAGGGLARHGGALRRCASAPGSQWGLAYQHPTRARVRRVYVLVVGQSLYGSQSH